MPKRLKSSHYLKNCHMNFVNKILFIHTLSSYWGRLKWIISWIFFMPGKSVPAPKKKENNNKKCIEPAEPERWHYRVRLMTPKGIFSCSIPMTFSPCGLGRTSEEAMRSAVWREFSMKLFSYLSYRPFAKQCCGAKLIMRPK